MTTAAPAQGPAGGQQLVPPVQQTERATEESVFICSVCGKGYSTPHGVDKHMGKNHDCTACSSSKAALQHQTRELESVHKRLAEAYKQITG